MTKSGFDAPRRSASEDKLHRLHFAASVYRVCTTVDRTWSVRVGLHGEWGSGKTTVLHFIREMAEADKHYVVDLNAWQYQSIIELRYALLIKVVSLIPPEDQSAQVKALLVKARTGALARDVQRNAKRLGAVVSTAIAPFGALGGLIEDAATITAAAGSGLGVSQDDFAILQRVMGDRRTIVFIDDIDRAEPSVLPRLFFALSEALDIPGFTFLLSFDRERVLPVLQQSHPGFDSDEFLDKIIEFPMFLPPITRGDRLALAKDEVAQHGLPFTVATLEAVLDLLPVSPRKLRLFIRSLKAMKAEFDRHDADELDDLMVMCIRVCEESAPGVVQRLISDDNFRRNVLLPVTRGDGLKEVTEAVRSHLAPLSKLARDIEWRVASTSGALLIFGRTLKAWDTALIDYYLRLVTDPHPVTNTEFRQVFSLWKKTPDWLTVSTWVEQQRRARSASTNAVLRDLVMAANNYRYNASEKAILAGATTQQASYLADGVLAVEFIGVLLDNGASESGVLSEDDVFSIWRSVGQNFHFQSSVYSELRAAETRLLERLLEMQHLDPARLINYFRGDRRDFGRAASDALTALRVTVRARIMGEVADDAIVALTKRNGLALHRSRWGAPLHEDLFFDPKGLLWQEPRRSKVIAVLNSASESDSVFENAYHMVGDLQDQTRMHAAPDVIRLLWAAATSRRMSRRWLGSLNSEIRPNLEQVLIQAEKLVPPVPLELPTWWADDLADIGPQDDEDDDDSGNAGDGEGDEQ